MRRIAVVGGAVTILSGGVAADGPALSHGPDLMPPPGVYRYPPVVRLYTWNGPYVGGHIGAGLDDSAYSDSHGAFIGGVHAGFNVRAGQALLGLEAQWTGIGASGGEEDTSLVLPGGVTGRFEAEVDWIATLTARLGIAWDRSLFYVKAGAALAETSYSASIDTLPGTTFEGEESRVGWALGVGYEYAFRNAWSTRLEYLFMDFGSDSASLSGPAGDLAVAGIDQQVHAVTLSVNYRFDWPIGGPLGTPY
jgi:outer membrane immunogenic protein